LTKLRIWKLI